MIACISSSADAARVFTMHASCVCAAYTGRLRPMAIVDCATNTLWPAGLGFDEVRSPIDIAPVTARTNGWPRQKLAGSINYQAATARLIGLSGLRCFSLSSSFP